MAGGNGFASQIPLPLEIGGVQLFIAPALSDDFAGLAPESKSLGPNEAEQAAGAFAPLLFVSPAQINFQLPWEVDLSSGFVNLWVLRDGAASAPARVAVTAFSPAVFTFDFGPGRAVAINPDGSVAHPEDSFGGAVSSRPVRRGEALVILATGMGPVTPNGISGSNSLDANGAFVQRDTVEAPRVTIGGVEQRVLFSGLSPEFVGVYQVNISVADGTPTGDAQPLVIEIGGERSRDDVTVAVEP
jgi:uncharacterized protein (TIGR03437 family)